MEAVKLQKRKSRGRLDRIGWSTFSALLKPMLNRWHGCFPPNRTKTQICTVSQVSTGVWHNHHIKWQAVSLWMNRGWLYLEKWVSYVLKSGWLLVTYYKKASHFLRMLKRLQLRQRRQQAGHEPPAENTLHPLAIQFQKMYIAVRFHPLLQCNSSQCNSAKCTQMYSTLQCSSAKCTLDIAM